jgi:hypothetical protein
MATLWTLGCDAADPRPLAAFWALALGYVDEPGYDDPDGASIIDPLGAGPAIGFLRERLIRAKVDQLVAAGATAVREESYGDQLGHVVMNDPEGNEFCVA